MTDLSINDPGIYDGIPNDVYHADPCPERSLSSGGARTILNECPAIFDYKVTHPQPPKRVFDFGHLAHKLILGEGDVIEVIDAPDYRTKAAKEARDAAYEDGAIPALVSEVKTAQEMADVVLNHPVAKHLFANGKAEQSMFWKDEKFGIWRRARPDYIVNGGTIYPDYKTCASAKPADLRKSLHNFGYHQQQEWYLDGYRALGICDDPKFVFVFQEKKPPYLVTLAVPDPFAREWGQILNAKAMDIFAKCLETDDWPGYSDEVVELALPNFAEYQYQDADNAGAYSLSEKFNKPLEK